MCLVRKMNIVKSEEEMMELRRGPWTVEEDFALVTYISQQGEGRWNSLPQSAGLKRSGKSCRLRWLNYLRPDVRRGNISLEEQLLILELHSRWGNRWSKIAQHLPGRTDNEIKNYWRTRVQKHAKQLKCDVNSKQFKDTMRYIWMPRLAERIQAAAAATSSTGISNNTSTATSNTTISTTASSDNTNNSTMYNNFETTNNNHVQLLEPNYTFTPENSSTTTAASSEYFGSSTFSDLTDSIYNYTTPIITNPDDNRDYSGLSTVSDLSNYSGYNNPTAIITIPDYDDQDYFQANCDQLGFTESLVISPLGYYNQGFNFPAAIEQNSQWTNGCEDLSDDLWNIEDIWY